MCSRWLLIRPVLVLISAASGSTAPTGEEEAPAGEVREEEVTFAEDEVAPLGPAVRPEHEHHAWLLLAPLVILLLLIWNVRWCSNSLSRKRLWRAPPT